MGTGQANVKAYNRLLSRLIEKDKVKPSWIVSHELPLDQVPEAAENFDQRKSGWTKVVLKPELMRDRCRTRNWMETRRRRVRPTNRAANLQTGAALDSPHFAVANLTHSDSTGIAMALNQTSSSRMVTGLR
jgi:hypothetical protein